MLTWNENTRRDHSGKVVSAGYKATLPHWGETSIHPHIHHPGELFLSCHGLGIDMPPLGQIGPLEAMGPAETVLMQTLKEHGVQCLEAMAVIGSTEDEARGKTH